MPKPNQNAAGQALNPIVPWLVSKCLDGSALAALLMETRISALDAFTPPLPMLGRFLLVLGSPTSHFHSFNNKPLQASIQGLPCHTPGPKRKILQPLHTCVQPLHTCVIQDSKARTSGLVLPSRLSAWSTTWPLLEFHLHQLSFVRQAFLSTGGKLSQVGSHPEGTTSFTPFRIRFLLISSA